MKGSISVFIWESLLYYSEKWPSHTTSVKEKLPAWSCQTADWSFFYTGKIQMCRIHSESQLTFFLPRTTSERGMCYCNSSTGDILTCTSETVQGPQNIENKGRSWYNILQIYSTSLLVHQMDRCAFLKIITAIYTGHMMTFHISHASNWLMRARLWELEQHLPQFLVFINDVTWLTVSLTIKIKKRTTLSFSIHRTLFSRKNNFINLSATVDNGWIYRGMIALPVSW